MKVRIETDKNTQSNEIIIKCAHITQEILDLHKYLSDYSKNQHTMVFYKGSKEYYFPIDDVLFFETTEDTVYAHTANESFIVKYRLYELESILPYNFMRVSKSSVLNTRKITSVTKNLTSASLIEFANTHKHVYVSRHYFKALQEKLKETRI